MGQWPIFRGASLRLPRLALPPLLRIAPSLAPGFWTDKHWQQRSLPHWTRGCLRGEETNLLLPSSNLVHKLNLSALVFWLPRLAGLNGNEVAVSGPEPWECMWTDRGWELKKTGNEQQRCLKLWWQGGQFHPLYSILHTQQIRVGFFGDWKEKMSKTHCKKVVFLGQIHVFRDVSENNFLSSQKPKPRRLLEFWWGASLELWAWPFQMARMHVPDVRSVCLAVKKKKN